MLERLRHHLWVTDLGFAFAAAALCAGIVSALAAARLASPWRAFEQPSPPDDRGPASLTRPPDGAAVARLFALAPSGSVAVEEPAAASAPLPLRLLGTAVAPERSLSRASVENSESRQSLVLAEGDEVLGATVAQIDRLRVTLSRGGRLEILELLQPAARSAPPLASAGEASGASVDGALAMRLLQNPGPELGKARFVPELREGAVVGWRLARLAPDSALASLGLLAGDVIRRINGFEIGTPAQLAEIVSRLAQGLGASSRIDVELDRGGAAVHRAYTLR